MAFEARVFNVLIASPGDTTEARNAVEGAILSWNRDRARSRKVVLLGLRWEFDAVPELGADPQSIINKQLADEADIVIGIFHSRLGASTPRGRSGSVEEIERAAERGAKTHVYFSDMPHPTNVDPEQLTALRDFKSTLQEQGLLGRYSSIEDLVAQVRTALERDVEDLAEATIVSLTPGSVSAIPVPTPIAGAILRTKYESDREPHTDLRGRMRMRTRRERLVIENLGAKAAENVRLEIEAVGPGEPPSVLSQGPIERIPPNSSIHVLIAQSLATAGQWRITITWTEDGEEFAETQSVTPF